MEGAAASRPRGKALNFVVPHSHLSCNPLSLSFFDHFDLSLLFHLFLFPYRDKN